MWLFKIKMFECLNFFLVHKTHLYEAFIARASLYIHIAVQNIQLFKRLL